MKGAIKQWLAIAAAILAGSIILTACAALKFQSQEEYLHKRVVNFIEAKMNRHWDLVYDHLTQAYKKEISKEAFLKRPRKVNFVKYKIDSFKILPSGDEALVKVLYEVEMNSFSFKNAPENQRWIKENGDWYLDLKDENPMGSRKPKKVKK